MFCSRTVSVIIFIMATLSACSSLSREEAVALWEKYKQDNNCVPQRHLGPKYESTFGHPGGASARSFGYALYKCEDGKLTYSPYEYY